jgi:hypothetical protein
LSKTRRWRVFAFVASAGLVSGCGINPSTVTPIEPTHSFRDLTCEQLAGEASRIQNSYVELRFKAKAGTKNRIATLNGEALAVNDALRAHACDSPAVRIPGDPWPETRNGYGR